MNDTIFSNVPDDDLIDIADLHNPPVPAVNTNECEDVGSIENTNRRRKKCVAFSFGLTNARSLRRKVGSLADFFREMRLSFCMITETWFHQSDALESFLSARKNDHDLSFVLKNQKRKGPSSRNATTLIP